MRPFGEPIGHKSVLQSRGKCAVVLRQLVAYWAVSSGRTDALILALLIRQDCGEGERL